MSICEYKQQDSCSNCTCATAEQIIQDEIVWGLSYRDYKNKEKDNATIPPMKSPMDIPFKICRGAQRKLLSKKRACKKLTPLKFKNKCKCKPPKKFKKLTMLDRNTMSQSKYMDYLAIPVIKMECECKKEPKIKKCCRCELEPCPPRLVQLAVPNKHKVFATWKEYYNFLPAERITRFEQILHTNQNLEPKEARYYFKKKDKLKRKEQLKKLRLKRRRKLEKKKGDTCWLKEQITKTACLIVEFFKNEPLTSLNYKQMLLSDGILDTLDAKKLLKKPSRKTKCHCKKTVVEIADKIAVWIDTITRFVDIQRVDSDEDIPSLALSSMESEGEEEAESESEYSTTEESVVGGIGDYGEEEEEFEEFETEGEGEGEGGDGLLFGTDLLSGGTTHSDLTEHSGAGFVLDDGTGEFEGSASDIDVEVQVGKPKEEEDKAIATELILEKPSSLFDAGEEGLSAIEDLYSTASVTERTDKEIQGESDKVSMADGEGIRGHNPSVVFEHSPDTVCCLSLKVWALWLLEVTHNAHSWTRWIACIIKQVKEFAAIVRGEVKLPNGETKVLLKSEWRKFAKETEQNIVAWRQYSAHVRDLSETIINKFHNKKVICCPKCQQDFLIKNICTAHDTLQALCEAMNCAAYWRRCLDELVDHTDKLCGEDEGDEVSIESDLSRGGIIEELLEMPIYSRFGPCTPRRQPCPLQPCVPGRPCTTQGQPSARDDESFYEIEQIVSAGPSVTQADSEPEVKKKPKKDKGKKKKKGKK